VASKDLQGWHPDPFASHEMRYFSAGRPTKLVRDGRAEAYDEPPDDWSSVGAASSSQAMPATVLAAPSDAAGPTRVLAATRNDVAAATTVAIQSPHTQQRRRRMEYVFVAAGAVVAVLVFVALAGGPSKPGIATSSFVTRAAQRTLAENTADYTLSATATVGGQSLAMGGRGQIDLAHDAMSFTVGASTAGGSITENELQVGGNRYLAITVNGHNLALSGGRHWLEAPFAATAGQSFATTSPDSSLALLSQQGARVTALGSQSIGGQTCNGYNVTPSQQAMLAGARQEFAREGMSSAETNAALQALRNVQPPTITAWFDSRSNLACRVDFYMQFGSPTSSGLGDVQAKLTFTHYGGPVKIAAPPQSDTFSIEQYLHSATRV
jgi:hypothetical protein